MNRLRTLGLLGAACALVIVSGCTVTGRGVAAARSESATAASHAASPAASPSAPGVTTADGKVHACADLGMSKGETTAEADSISMPDLSGVLPQPLCIFRTENASFDGTRDVYRATLGPGNYDIDIAIFSQSSRRIASILGTHGWITNDPLPTGDIQFQQWCRKGIDCTTGEVDAIIQVLDDAPVLDSLGKRLDVRATTVTFFAKRAMTGRPHHVG